MSSAIAERPEPSSLLEKVLVKGDLAQLSPEDRLIYYRRICESLGLNPLTGPFEYITLNGKLRLYARKDATDQLRKRDEVSVTITSRERSDDLSIVTARATLPSGRTDEALGAVAIAGLKGDALANAIMKSETKAKRRVTLSICGLGMLDESEIETIVPSTEPPAIASPPPDSGPRTPKPQGETGPQKVARWEADLVAAGVCAAGELKAHFDAIVKENGSIVGDELAKTAQAFSRAAKVKKISAALATVKLQWDAGLKKDLGLPADATPEKLSLDQFKAVMTKLAEEAAIQS